MVRGLLVLDVERFFLHDKLGFRIPDDEVSVLAHLDAALLVIEPYQLSCNEELYKFL